MKWILFFILSVMLTDPAKIAKINTLKQEAEEAFNNKNFELAYLKYSYLVDSLKVNEEEIRLNMAHAIFQLGDTTAKFFYQKLNNASNNKIRSISFQQQGVILKDEEKLEQSLENLKYAIKADPQNKDARYNYEVVKKLLQEQEQQSQDDQDGDGDGEGDGNKDSKDKKQGNNKDKENKNGDKSNDQNQKDKDQEKQEKENEGKENEEQKKEQQKRQRTKEKLAEMKISEEKARMILEAMRQNEIKYLQQRKRKPTKKPESGKPDW